MRFLILAGLLLASSAPVLVFNQPSLPTGMHDVEYSQTLTASGGVPPYKWMQVGLPIGMQLDSKTGVISGTATLAGSYKVGLQVADVEKPAQRVQRTVTLVIQ